MVLICNDPEKGLNFYYCIKDSKIYAIRQEGGNGVPIGITTGMSVILYSFIRKFNIYINIEPDTLFFMSLILGVVTGLILTLIFKIRLNSRISKTAFEYCVDIIEMKKFVRLGKKQFYTNLWLMGFMVLVEWVYRMVMIMAEPGNLTYAFCHYVIWIINGLLVGSFLVTKPFVRLKFYRENS